MCSVTNFIETIKKLIGFSILLLNETELPDADDVSKVPKWM